MSALQQVPLYIAIAPFPEGWDGDADEYGQELVQLMTAYLEGNFLVGLVLPPGSTLPTNDQGPIFMGGAWYWWNPATGIYVPQTLPVKPAKNYVKNCIYQIQQTGSAFSSLPAARTPVYDMAVAALSQANVLSVGVRAGPPAGGLNDFINTAIEYTVGTTLVPTPAATDLLAHEHLIEGSDIQALQGQVTALSFWAWTTAPGTYSVYLTNSGRDHSYVINFTVGTASTWTYVTVPNIPAFPTSGTWSYSEGATGLYIGFPMVVGTQWQTANLGSWQAAFLAGSASNINFCTVTNNQLAITGIKLEANTQSTYLTVPSFEDDFQALCRYYFTNFSYQTKTSGVPLRMNADANGHIASSLVFPVRMASAPTVTPYGFTSHAAGNITDLTLGSDIPLSTLSATQVGVNEYANLQLSTTGTFGSVTGATGSNTGLSATCNIVSGETYLSGFSIPLTTNMAGAPIVGSGIPAGATIVEVIGSSSCVISISATGGGAGVAVAIGTPLLTVNSTTGISVGDLVQGTGIPAGTTVIQVNATGNYLILSNPVLIASSESLTIGALNVTTIPSTTGMVAGMGVTATGIAAGSKIANVASGTAITLTLGAPPGSDLPFTVNQVAQGDNCLCFITADARLT